MSQATCSSSRRASDSCCAYVCANVCTKVCANVCWRTFECVFVYLRMYVHVLFVYQKMRVRVYLFCQQRTWIKPCSLSLKHTNTYEHTWRKFHRNRAGKKEKKLARSSKKSTRTHTHPSHTFTNKRAPARTCTLARRARESKEGRKGGREREREGKRERESARARERE